jgi:hypothetical protein
MLRNISRVIIVAGLVLSSLVSVGQTPSIPDGILFQAVATDAKGNPASNRTIYGVQ